MKIILNNKDLLNEIHHNENLGFVPTMGAIHEGHISLIKKSQINCKKTLVSIFVNPTQFNKKKDFENYPRNKKKDLLILKKLKVNYVFMPNTKDIYKKKRSKKIKLFKKDKILCAKYRKGHFEGVLDIMDRLTNLIKPKKIFLGKKDFQQFILVKKFIYNKYKIKVTGCTTIRDKNNIALSSRNRLLNKKQLFIAAKIVNDLILFKKKFKKSKNINYHLKKIKLKLKKDYKIKIEYLENRKNINLEKIDEFKKSKIFIAYYLKKVRLIDNL